MAKLLPISLILVLFVAAQLFAQGWTDFEFTIDGDFEFVRCNSLQTLIMNGDTILLDPTDYPSIGPIDKYANSSRYIFTKNLGRKLRNSFDGDNFEEVDDASLYFFIIDKKLETISGPLDQTQFNAHSATVNAGPIRWKHPYNPLGFFCLFSCSTIIISPFVLLFYSRYRRRRMLDSIRRRNDSPKNVG